MISNDGLRFIAGAKTTSKHVLMAGALAASLWVLPGCNNSGGSSGGATNGSTAGSDISGSDAVATVNGENVTKGELYSLLAAANGERALTQLIRQKAILQEAKKNNITVSDAEVDALIEERKKNNPQAAELEEIQKAGGPRLATLRDQVRTLIATERLVTKDVKVDDAQLKSWFEKNRAHYDTPERLNLGLLVASTKVRADTLASQLKSKSKTFKQLVEEQQKANDQLAKGSNDKISVDKTSLNANLGPVLAPLVAKLKVGQYTPPVKLTNNSSNPAFVIATIFSSTPGVKADLTKQRAQIEQDYKLEQLARETAKQGGNKQPFEQLVKQYEQFVAQQSAQTGSTAKPTYHDILQFMTQQKSSEIQENATKNLDVKVSDTEFQKVAEQFKPASAPGASSSPAAAAPSPANAKP